MFFRSEGRVDDVEAGEDGDEKCVGNEVSYDSMAMQVIYGIEEQWII